MTVAQVRSRCEESHRRGWKLVLLAGVALAVWGAHPERAAANRVTCDDFAATKPQSDIHWYFEHGSTTGNFLAALAAPPGIKLPPALPPHALDTGAAPGCMTDDRGPLSPACPDPGSGAVTYAYDEHIPKDATSPTDQILDASGRPLGASNLPCPGASFTELAPQDNAAPMPGETVPADDRNYRVQFTVNNPRGGQPGGLTPTIDVQVKFGGGENRDPKLAIAKLQIALVRLEGGTHAANAPKARCFDLTSRHATFKPRSAAHGRCGPRVWLSVPGTTDAHGIFHVKQTIGHLPQGSYESWSRATTKGGVLETTFVSGRNRVAFKVKH
jgi:hypothetical protein